LNSNPQHTPTLRSFALANSVYNKKRKTRFGTLTDGGWFSAAPDDVAVNRAIRTNNPGALNIAAWQRKRPGFVGKTLPDAAGNQTTIYQTPEHGVAAWWYLLFVVYGFGNDGQFELGSAAKKYAGGRANQRQIKAYIDGWSKWSNGALQSNTIIHFTSNDEMLMFAAAEFAHEAAAVSPLAEAQILKGFALERQTGSRKK
jgi:D-alanyl-D-alanine carboxypeptidase